MSLVLGVPALYSLSHCPIRVNLVFILGPLVIGSWLKCLLNHSFAFAFVGHYILASTYSFHKNLITRLSAVWFPPHRVSSFSFTQRLVSTSVMYATLVACDFLSLFWPTFFIDTDSNDPSRFPQMRA